MENQRFWAVINKTTGKCSRNMSTYNIYHTRESARKANIFLHKNKSSNYKIDSLIVFPVTEAMATY
jgi:hypothetical protein